MESLLKTNTSDYMLDKKLEIMFDMNNKKLYAEITELKKAVIGLSEEVASLKKAQAQSRHSASAPSYEEPIRHQPEPVHQAPQIHAVQNHNSQSGETRSDDGRTRARTGDYNPDDVSIDKFFYFGNKGQKR
ncbi:hypothetical protein J4212_00205 [Candidatus Woesearchaeota archaeon]|nr:hypothetical protein [Candidatus Woesearchaeota archaeon]